MPARDAANFDPSASSSGLTARSAAFEPVKNVLSPSAASTPLVSPSNAIRSSALSPEIRSRLSLVTAAVTPSIASSCVARLASDVSLSSPSRSM